MPCHQLSDSAAGVKNAGPVHCLCHLIHGTNCLFDRDRLALGETAGHSIGFDRVEVVSSNPVDAGAVSKWRPLASFPVTP